MKKTQGFTLVEIMIVVAIIGILAAIAIPNFVRNRNQSQMNACIANMKQVQGACELIAVRGETVSTDSVGKEVKGYTNLHCPADSAKKTYSFTTGATDDDPYVVTCPAGKTTGDFKHILPAAAAES